jgi:hypothetical protein
VIDQRLFLFCKANIASYLFTEPLLLKEGVSFIAFWQNMRYNDYVCKSPIRRHK